MSTFTDRARTEAEKRWPAWANGTVPTTRDQEDTRELLRDGFEAGARWAAEQDPTREEVGAAARALLDELGGTPDELESMHVEAAHAALLAARDVRKEQGR